MATELKTDDFSAEGDVYADKTVAKVKVETKSATEDATAETVEQVKRVTAQVVDKLGYLDKYFGEFFVEYKRPLIAIGLFFGLFLSIKMTLAILDAINDVPVLAPSLELIGLLYSGWFVYRYLWKASNRRELANELNALKDQVLGRASQM